MKGSETIYWSSTLHRLLTVLKVVKTEEYSYNRVRHIIVGHMNKSNPVVTISKEVKVIWHSS